jgi:DNA-binding helix-hairpin-helix protein with protein kinase domain
MTPTQVSVAGRSLILGRLIGKGGEGEVYAIAGDADHAIKLYTTADRPSREEKIVAMVRGELAKRSSLAAFPVSVVRLQDGTFGGFVMRLVSGHKPLHELYAPGPRKHHFPQADYRFLARTATNIARAFASIHATNCVVGDINHSGILVSSKATAALIDADSFQFSDGADRYLCRVGVPEYTPPELQGKPLHGTVRTTDHDAFGLAVVIFQVLLMGRHPFVGTVRKGDIPPLHENVEHFRYVYTEGRDVGMDQPPGTPSLSDFSPELAKLFECAFSKGSVGSRPSAAVWVQALERFESTLIQCTDNPLHFGPRDASECAWCELEQQLGTVLFVPYLPSGPSVPHVDPGRANFNLELVWARIERFKVPSNDQLQPFIPKLTRPEPSEAARNLKEAKPPASRSWTGVSFLLACVGLLFLVPKMWPMALLLGGVGFWMFRDTPPAPTIDLSRFRTAYVEAQVQWHREVDNWRQRIGLADVALLIESLRTARQRYLGAMDEERRLTENYKSRRHELQLNNYLEGFDLARARIKGIGQAKLAVLSSYGVDTAADISANRLQTVPGFGEALSSRLVEWRDRHVARFVYSASTNDSDRQEMARIASLVEAKLAPLRKALSAGVADLEQKVQRLHDLRQREDAVLVRIHQRVEQARIDLEFLGQPIPAVEPPARTNLATPVSPRAGQRPTVPASSQPTRQMPLPGGAPTCPRCSSSMRQRLARRGRNAGNYFWGCSRYPSCKGTRPI